MTDARESAWLAWWDQNPAQRYGSVNREVFLAGWDAAVRVTAEHCAQLAEEERLTESTGDPGDVVYDQAISDVVAAIRSAYPTPEGEK